MKIISENSYSNKVEIIERLKKNDFKKDVFTVTILGWQDGNYFKELCFENGGEFSNHFSLFDNTPLNRKIKSINKLIDIIIPYITEEYLRSVNNHVRYFYDIHIWSGTKYIVFNPFLKKYLFIKLNLFDQVLGNMIDPKWINSELLNIGNMGI